jgi:hypothetical protein
LVRMAEVGRTHRVFFAPGGRKASLVVKDASPEEALSSPDAEQGWRDGERVREQVES